MAADKSLEITKVSLLLRLVTSALLGALIGSRTVAMVALLCLESTVSNGDQFLLQAMGMFAKVACNYAVD